MIKLAKIVLKNRLGSQNEGEKNGKNGADKIVIKRPKQVNSKGIGQV